VPARHRGRQAHGAQGGGAPRPGRRADPERRALRALAAQPRTGIFSASFAREVQLANAASVRKAVDALAATELVTHDGDAWMVADPFFRYWLTWIFGTGSTS
jgi:hypothetical protein